MILSVSHLTSKTPSTHFSAHKTPTPAIQLSFPSQNNLYLESFPSTNLADAPPLTHLLQTTNVNFMSGYYFNHHIWLTSHYGNIPKTPS